LRGVGDRAAVHALALEAVGRLDEALVGADVEAEGFGPRRRRLLRALQRAGIEGGHRMPGQTRDAAAAACGARGR